MTHVEEQNMRAGLKTLIDVACQNTSDSRYYVARLLADMCSRIAYAELKKPPANDRGEPR